MNAIQRFPQDDQILTFVATPLLEVQDAPLRSRSCAVNEEPQALSPGFASSPAPASEETTEIEVREPLRELCKNDKESSEETGQEQDEEGENNDGSEKVSDYITKVLEKIVKQRGKMSKLNAILEKKGLISEKKVAQIQNMLQDLEEASDENSNKEGDDENDSTENHSKENLSPLQARHAAKFDALALRNGSKGASPVHQKAMAKYSLEDVLQISRRDISYGVCFPGQVMEEHLDIVNKSGHDFVVQIIVTCLNDELQNTEEYVYSVRRSHLYDYNDKHYLIMAPYSCAGFKFAMKVPNMRIDGKIIGQVEISVQGIEGSYILDLTTHVTIPKVFCPKELFFNGLNHSVIKLAVKEGKKQDMKLPFRNNGPVPVTLELEFFEPKDQETGRAMFDCLVHPNVITINPNSSTLATIMVKPWKTLVPIKGLERPKGHRKILTGRVKDSALVYSFVFWIEIY